MTTLDRIQIARAEEQMEALTTWPLHDPDSWAMARPAKKQGRIVLECAVADCTRRGGWGGLCSLHYSRWKRGKIRRPT